MNILIAFLFPIFCLADENYNFYFQKAPGPMTVMQGTNSPAPSDSASAPSPELNSSTAAEGISAAPATPGASALPAAAPLSQLSAQPSASVAEAEWPEVPRRITLSLGMQMLSGGRGLDTPSMTEVTSGLYRQQTITLEGDVFSRLALFGDLYVNARSVRLPYFYYKNSTGTALIPAADATDSEEVKKGKLNYGGGLAFHALKIGSPRLADFTLSLLAGAMTVQQAKYNSDSRYDMISLSGPITTKAIPFAGARARLMAKNSIGAEISYRLFPTVKDNALRFAGTYAF